jgi:hypothetical protein
MLRLMRWIELGLTDEAKCRDFSLSDMAAKSAAFGRDPAAMAMVEGGVELNQHLCRTKSRAADAAQKS